MPSTPCSKDDSAKAPPSLGSLQEGGAGVTTITSPSSFPLSLCLEPVKIKLAISSMFSSPSEKESAESFKALLLSAFKTERGSLGQLAEKNRHYLKIPRAGVTGSQSVNLFAKKIKHILIKMPQRHQIQGTSLKCSSGHICGSKQHCNFFICLLGATAKTTQSSFHPYL